MFVASWRQAAFPLYTVISPRGWARDAALFPSLCCGFSSLGSLGQSVEFRQIWSLEISNKPNQSEPEEPKIRFVAGIHGNAPVGTELLLALAEFLCMNYKKNPAVTKVRSQCEGPSWSPPVIS